MKTSSVATSASFEKNEEKTLEFDDECFLIEMIQKKRAENQAMEEKINGIIERMNECKP